MPEFKTCRKCGKELPIEQFYKHSAMAGGHLNFCIECVKARVASHRTANIDRIRDYDRRRALEPARHAHNLSNSRRYAVENSEKRTQVNEQWCSRNAHKRRAEIAVRNAIRDGRLIPQPCWCGAKAQAHHSDYSRPMDVQWLCTVHHGQMHRLYNAISRLQKSIDQQKGAVA